MSLRTIILHIMYNNQRKVIIEVSRVSRALKKEIRESSWIPVFWLSGEQRK